LVCVEPAQILIDGILTARVLSRFESSTQESSRLTSQHSCSETGVHNRCAYIILANVWHEPQTAPIATVLLIAEEMSELLVDSINAGCKSDADSSIKPRRRKKNEALYNKLLKGKLDHLSREDRQLIEPVLLNYAHLFHDEETNDFPGSNVIEY